MIHVVRLSSDRDPQEENRLTEVLKSALAGRDVVRVKSVSDFLLKAMTGEMKKILFAVSLPENGYASAWMDLIGELMKRPGLYDGMEGAVILDGGGPLFTKGMGRSLIFAANYAGISFPGKPLVEATGNLSNFSTIGKVKGLDNFAAYKEMAKDLVDRLEGFNYNDFRDSSSSGSEKKVLAIHAGNKETSNSLMLLDFVKSSFGSDVNYEEISIRNGEIVDCRGCDFDTCKHLGESGECFYGGVMVEKVYPAILDCDILILVCPNYNDSVGANMVAMFNRLTALFYNNSFSNKKIYSIIVSGYSGGELLAEQIIGAMNCNKGFILPPRFALIETANDPGSIREVSDIEKKASEFAARILRG